MFLDLLKEEFGVARDPAYADEEIFQSSHLEEFGVSVKSAMTQLKGAEDRAHSRSLGVHNPARAQAAFDLAISDARTEAKAKIASALSRVVSKHRQAVESAANMVKGSFSFEAADLRQQLAAMEPGDRIQAALALAGRGDHRIFDALSTSVTPLLDGKAFEQAQSAYVAATDPGLYAALPVLGRIAEEAHAMAALAELKINSRDLVEQAGEPAPVLSTGELNFGA